MPRKIDKTPKTAKQTSELLFSDADVADISAAAKETGKKLRQEPQPSPRYQVTDLSKTLREKLSPAATPPAPVSKRNTPIRVATEPIGQKGILWASRGTTLGEEVDRRRAIKRAGDILEGRLTISKTKPRLRAWEGETRFSEPVDAQSTGNKIAKSISDEYFKNRPAEAVDELGRVKNSHLESELYRLNDHMAKYSIDPRFQAQLYAPDAKPNLLDPSKALSPIGGLGNSPKMETPGEPLQDLFDERDHLVGRLVSISAPVLNNKRTFTRPVRALYDTRTLDVTGGEGSPMSFTGTPTPVARVNEQGIFGFTNPINSIKSTLDKSTSDDFTSDTFKYPAVLKSPNKLPEPSADSLPTEHEFESRGGDVWIKRTVNGVHVPQFDQLVHKKTQRVPEGKTISVQDFTPHPYALSPDGRESYVNIDGVDSLVHRGVTHHYVVNYTDGGKNYNYSHSEVGGLFALHPRTNKIVPVNEESVLPSREVRDNVAKGMITIGAAEKFATQSGMMKSSNPAPTVTRSDGRSGDAAIIHDLWMKHGPSGTTDTGPIKRENASEQVKQAWFKNAHEAATTHFINNNIPIPSNPYELVDNFFSKERKKASYRRDAKKAADLGLM